MDDKVIKLAKLTIFVKLMSGKFSSPVRGFLGKDTGVI